MKEFSKSLIINIWKRQQTKTKKHKHWRAKKGSCIQLKAFI